MINDIQIYNGNKPFFFVSYSHRDSDKIAPYLKALQDAGYNIWFDKGIEAGTEWSNNIADHLSRCSAFLFFVSKNSVKSENCLDEVAYAKSHNKPSLLVFIDDDADLPLGTEMQTARFQRMFLSRQESLGHFVDNFAQASIFDCCRNQGAEPLKADAYKPIKQKKNNKGKGLIIGIIAGVVVVALVAVIVLLFIKNPSDDVSAETPSDETTETAGAETTTTAKEQETEEVPAVIELSDSLSDSTFRLDGVVYQLPVSYQTFKNNGWTLNAGSKSPDSYIGGYADEAVSIVKDGQSLNVTIYNDTEDAKQLKDCMIGEITVSKTRNVDFCIAGEITYDSTEEDIAKKVGVPTDKNDDDSYTMMHWNFSETKYVKICLYKDTPEYNFITIANFLLSDKKTEATKTPPAYLDDYKKPSALGDDLTSAIISVDNVLYELPVPLREFTNNGWTISSGDSDVISGEIINVNLEKDGHSMSVEVANFYSKKTLTENCMVISITVTADDAPSFILSGNITADTTTAEMNALTIDGISIYEGPYYTSYSYQATDDTDNNFNLQIYFDNESKKLNDFTISRYIYDKIITDE